MLWDVSTAKIIFPKKPIKYTFIYFLSFLFYYIFFESVERFGLFLFVDF